MDESERREFGAEIRAMRRGQGLTQFELAAKADVGVRTIRNIEAGRHEPQAGSLGAILDALNYHRPEKPWDESVEALLQMIGWRLSRLDPQRRTEMIGRLTLLAIGDDPNGLIPAKRPVTLLD